MKLKKIASLALVGVMAVSMLAGCGDKGTTNNDGDQGETQTSTIAQILNDAQTGDAKVAFSDNALMNTALQAAIQKDGINANFVNAVKLAGVESVAAGASYGSFVTNGLLNETTNYYYVTENQKNDPDGKTFTYVTSVKFTGYSDAASAMKAVAEYIDGETEKLPAHSALIGKVGVNVTDGKVTDQNKLTTGGKYYAFTYTGDAALVVINEANGTTSYNLVYSINQTVAEKTL